MKKNLFLVALLFTLSKVVAQDIYIMPQPVEMQRQTGTFTLKSDMIIGTNTNSADNQRVAKLFAEKIATATGFKLSAAPNKSANQNAINFTINPTPNPTIGTEGYTLEVTPQKVILAANTEGGFFMVSRLCCNYCQKRLIIKQLRRLNGKCLASKLRIIRVLLGAV